MWHVHAYTCISTCSTMSHSFWAHKRTRSWMFFGKKKVIWTWNLLSLIDLTPISHIELICHKTEDWIWQEINWGNQEGNEKRKPCRLFYALVKTSRRQDEVWHLRYIYGHDVRIIKVWKNPQNMAVNMEKAFYLNFILPPWPSLHSWTHSDVLLHIKIWLSGLLLSEEMMSSP